VLTPVDSTAAPAAACTLCFEFVSNSTGAGITTFVVLEQGKGSTGWVGASGICGKILYCSSMKCGTEMGALGGQGSAWHCQQHSLPASCLSVCVLLVPHWLKCMVLCAMMGLVSEIAAGRPWNIVLAMGVL
jgi:hypothetical protein